MQDLKNYLIQSISAEKFYEDLLSPVLKWGSDEWVNIFCPFHNPEWQSGSSGKSPSLSISKAGPFRCHSSRCGIHGSNIVNFYMHFTQFSFKKALRRMFAQWIRPVISQKEIEKFHETLKDSPAILKYLRRHRGLNNSTLRRFMIGFDGTRITIPIYNYWGFCVNVRKYDCTGKMKVKIINYGQRGEGYGGVELYPISNLTADKNSDVLVCEGEWDALLAAQEGYCSVTSTSGANSWPEKYDPLMKGRSVRIAYDVNDPDDAGQVGARTLASHLSKIAKDIKVVQLPLKNRGGDITDYFVKEQKTKANLDKLIERTPFFSNHQAEREIEKPSSWVQVKLSDASLAKYYFVPIEIECLVSGKGLSPYMPPRKVKAISTNPDTGVKEEFIYSINITNNKDILRLIRCSHNQLPKALIELLGLSHERKWEFETLSTFNVEELVAIPTIDSPDQHYVLRQMYYLGHGIETNRAYKMRGYTVPDPKTQLAIHIITEAIPAHDSIEDFRLTDEIKARLKKKFKPRAPLDEHFMKLADWQSRNVTKIRKRADLHTAVDLVFHSPLSFNFNRETIEKGWLEALIIGDTRCGKGYVAEGLCRFYRLGESATGENCTFAGLIGGLQQAGDRWFITWGKIPLNDRRLVIIDEMSAMPLADIGRMSRIRSEGVAEIVKIQSEKTKARTRLIWLSNPRSGHPMSHYNNGVESISELVGASEDVSRLDFALTVATSEVPSYIINSPPEQIDDADHYSYKDFRNLILWVWSRKPEQIKFSKQATDFILRSSIVMGVKYSATIPLIQAENMRIKLAKMAAAVAARCFSTNKTCEKIIVKKKHVIFARKFLTAIYSKPSMGYDRYSSRVISTRGLKNERAVERLIRDMNRYQNDFIDGMLERRQITISDIADFSGVDVNTARETTGKLVRLGCITREEQWYTKRPPFIVMLRLLKERLLKDDNHATPE